MKINKLILLIIYFIFIFNGISISQSKYAILKVQNDVVLINGGSDNGFKKGSKHIVKRFIKNHYFDIAKIKIEKVLPDQSAARVITKSSRYDVRVGDFVFELEYSVIDKMDFQIGVHIGQIRGIQDNTYLQWGITLNPYANKYFGFSLDWSKIKTDKTSQYGDIKLETRILSYGFRYCIPIKRISFLIDLYGLNRDTYDHKNGFGFNAGLQLLVDQHIYLSILYKYNNYGMTNFGPCGAANETIDYDSFQLGLAYGFK